MLYQAGILYAETRAERHLARSRVNAALRSFESKTTRLTEAVINRLHPHTAAQSTIEQLLELIATHPCLAPETALLQRYCAAFPELSETAAKRRERTLTQARHSLAEALWPHHQARRFAYAQGYRAA